MTDRLKIKNALRTNRRLRIRAKIKGTVKKPRLNIFRSLKHVYAQIIDDNKGVTLVSANDLEVKAKKGKKMDKATEVGKLIAKKALDAKIKTVVFDRGGYKFHGRVKAVAEAARESGLEF